jgi:hypothetical protein
LVHGDVTREVEKVAHILGMDLAYFTDRSDGGKGG